MPGRIIRFGSTELPPGFAPAGETVSRDVQPMKLPRTDGARVIQGYAGEKIINIRGRLINGPIPILNGQSDMRAAMDSIKALCDDGPASLYFYDDRYLRNVQARAVSFSHEPHLFEKVVDVDIEFVTGDPFTYHGNETVDTWNSPSGTRTVTVSLGNTTVQPNFKFTTNSASINWTLANNTTGRSLQIAGSGLTAGQVIEVDTLARTVKIGTTDYMTLFIAGSEFFPLQFGANSLQITTTLGTLTTLQTVYRARWAP